MRERMRARRRRVERWLLLGFGLWLWALSAFAQAPPWQVDQVQCIDTDASAPPGANAPWRDCVLPDRWSATGRQHAGSVWYRLRWPSAARSGDARAQGLWIPTLSMNAEFWIDGQRLASTTDKAEGLTTRHWNHPWLLPLPVRREVSPDVVEAHMKVMASSINEGTLSAPWVGAMDDLRTRHDTLVLWRVTAPGWGVVFGLSLGVVFILIRLRDARQNAWGYFGAGALLWSLANLNLTMLHMPVSDATWEMAVHLTLFLGLLCLVLFAMAFSGVLTPRRKLGFAIYGMLLCVSIPWISLRGDGRWMMVLTLPLLVAAGYAMAAIVAFTRRLRLSSIRVFALVALLTLLAALNDWVVRAGFAALDRPFMLPLVAPLLLAALAWMLADDYARARADIDRANHDLDLKVRERERQLASIHEEELRVRTELAAANERARVLRDMHDGAGAHLSTAIRMLRAEPNVNAELAQALNDALDQLKLSVDVMNLPPGDVEALLASVRYRLGARLEQAGITMDWNIEDLPLWPLGQRQWALRHLQYIVFEIISNGLQHARASHLRVHARPGSGVIELEFADNGRGLSEAGPLSLNSVRSRAHLIEANLELADAAPGLIVRLRLSTATPTT
jgi:signal transduction histidine kinase